MREKHPEEIETSEMRENQGTEFTDKRKWEWGIKRGHIRREERKVKGEQERGETYSEGCGTRMQTDREGQPLCGTSQRQTGSPDDTSDDLTYPDSLISLFKTCWRHRGEREHTPTQRQWDYAVKASLRHLLNMWPILGFAAGVMEVSAGTNHHSIIFIIIYGTVWNSFWGSWIYFADNEPMSIFS